MGPATVEDFFADSGIQTGAQPASMTSGSSNNVAVSNDGDALRFEMHRLSTFEGWPANAKVEPRKIARAGFFYTGRYMEAKCKWCGCVLATWEYGDQVMARHREANPDCPFVKQSSDNVPLILHSSSIISNSSVEADDGHHGVPLLIRNASHLASADHETHFMSGSEGSPQRMDTSSDGTNHQSASPSSSSSTDHPLQRSPRSIDEDVPPSSSIFTSADRAQIHSRQTSMTTSSANPSSSSSSSGGRPVAGMVHLPCYRETAVGNPVYLSEAERLATFQGWPVPFIRPADLANAGFVYKGIDDRVECVFCGGGARDWSEEDFPHTEHRSLFPSCRFIQGFEVGNIPIVANHYGDSGVVWPSSSSAGTSSGTSSFRGEEDEDQVGHRINGLRTSDRQQLYSHGRMDMELDESELNQLLQNPQNFTGRQHSDGGLDETGIRCRPNGLKGSSNLKLTREGAAKGSVSHHDIGIIRHSGPANPKYTTFDARMRTFEDWPMAIKQQPKDLAEAGFYYVGLSDQTKCFYCDGGLRKWSPEDEPWTEHARWFSECGFVRLVKGDEFISKCINANPPKDVPGLPPLAARERPLRKVKEEELMNMMASPLVGQVLKMGAVDSARIKAALRKKLEETGTGFKLTNDLLEAAASVQLLQPETTSASSIAASTSTLTGRDSSSSSSSSSVHSHPPASTCSSSTAAEPKVSPAAPAEESQRMDEDESQPSMPVLPPEIASERQKSPVSISEEVAPVVEPGCSKSSAASVDLEQENQRLKDQRTCKVCMDNEISVVFLPCAHLICCVKCAPSLKDCPFCRQPIEGSVRAYMS